MPQKVEGPPLPGELQIGKEQSVELVAGRPVAGLSDVLDDGLGVRPSGGVCEGGCK